MSCLGFGSAHDLVSRCTSTDLAESAKVLSSLLSIALSLGLVHSGVDILEVALVLLDLGSQFRVGDFGGATRPT